MQNKQALIGIIAAAIILIGAGGVFLYSQNKPDTKQPNTTVADQQQAPVAGNTLGDLLKSGKTQKCDFSYEDENGKSEGVTYISGDNMRTDINITEGGKTSTIYVVRNGDDSYIWGTGFPNNTGLKMTISVDEFLNDESSKKYIDPGKDVDYKCSAWVADSTILTPPSNIKFNDLSGFMGGTTTSPTSGSQTGSSQCSVCNSLTGENKTMCLQQLGC